MDKRIPKNKVFIIILIFIFIVFTFACCENEKENNKNQQNNVTEQNNIENLDSIFISEPQVNEPEPIYSAKTDNSIKDTELDNEAKQILDLPDEYSEPEPNSSQKIEMDLADGKIDKEEACKLNIFAAYNSNRLPEEYKSEESSGSAQFDIKYLVENWDSLSETTKKTVEPYILPITDPESFFYPNDSKKLYETKKGISFIDTVYAAGDPLFTCKDIAFRHDGQEFTISYIEYSTWSEELKRTIDKMAETVEEAIKHSWDKFMPLMKDKPSMPYLIELVDMTNPKSIIYGEEFSHDGKYRIRINYIYGANEKIVKSTTAHELFHSFQDELGIGFEHVEEKWLCEATAVWSENYAYEALNFEHLRHNGFFRTLDRERIDFDDTFEYYSYMLFYYLTDYEKINLIPDIIEHSADNGSSSIRSYFENNISNFKDIYARFALYNWNRPPYDKYYDYGRIIGSPNGKCLKKNVMGFEDNDEHTVTLEPGAIKYYYYVFDQSSKGLKHVNLSFENSLSNDQNLKRQALLKIDGKWVKRDMSSVSKKEYCYRRKSENEKFEALVLIYSNSSFQDMQIDVDTFKVSTGGCPKEMEILITAEYTYQTDDYLWKSSAELSETLEIVDHCFYLVKNSDYNYEGNGIYEGKPLINSEGSYSISIDEPDLNNSFPRILKSTTENIKGLEEAYEKYGIVDNIPPEGIIVTLPAVIEEKDLNGSTVIFMPEPVGNEEYSKPLPLDGLTQLGAFYPKPQHWYSDGIKTSIVVNPYARECPLTSAFELETNTFIEEFEDIKDMIPKDMPTLEDLEDIELPGGGGLDDFEFGLEGEEFGDDSPIESIDALIEALSPNNIGGANISVEIEVEGMYTEFYQ